MNKYQIFGLISGQVLMGLLFGFGGVVITAILGTLYEEIAGNYVADLSTTILYLLYGGYAGMQIGISYDGHKYLREKGRPRDFKRFFGQSIAGLIIGLLIFYYFFLSPGHINNTFKGLLSYVAPFMPMIGAIIGFDFGLIKKLNEN